MNIQMIKFKKSSPFSGTISNLPKTSGSRNLRNLVSSTVLISTLTSTHRPLSNSISSRWFYNRSNSKSFKSRSATVQLPAMALRLVTSNRVKAKARVAEVERLIEMNYHLRSLWTSRQRVSPKKRQSNRSRKKRRPKRKIMKSRKLKKSQPKPKARKLMKRRHQTRRSKKS